MMGDEKSGWPQARQFAGYDALHGFGGCFIEGRKGLVEQEELRLDRERPGEGNAARPAEGPCGKPSVSI